MNRFLLWALGSALPFPGFCVTAAAQHVTAPPGCYPQGYAGDIWVGTVTKVDNATREITLEDMHEGEKQTFAGVLEKGYMAKHKSGRVEPLKPSDVPVGAEVAVYYTPESKRANGKKVAYNRIIDIDRLRNLKPMFKKHKAFAGGLATPASVGVLSDSCSGGP